MIDHNVKIVSHRAALDFAIMEQKMFAFAQPSKW
jgi:hypothetical protein